MKILPHPATWNALPPAPGKSLTITIADPARPPGREFLCEFGEKTYNDGFNMHVPGFTIPQELFDG